MEKIKRVSYLERISQLWKTRMHNIRIISIFKIENPKNEMEEKSIA